jgi:hypothetical protein
LDATGDRPPQRWQQQARPGRYLADLSTVDLTAVGYARAAMPGCGGGADEVGGGFFKRFFLFFRFSQIYTFWGVF